MLLCLLTLSSIDAEIYNEKIYDLLESPLPTPTASSSSSTHSATPSSVFQAGLGLLSVGGAKAKGFMKGLSTVKRNALTLKHDAGAGNKYVHGMKEIRVHSAEVCWFSFSTFYRILTNTNW